MNEPREAQDPDVPQASAVPSEPAAPLVQHDKAYDRPEIAALLGISPADVQELWDNWDAQDGPRMNYSKQTGRNPHRVSNGAQIQQYVDRYRANP